MKLKNTLGIVISSLIAVSSMSVLAQGQNAVESEVFVKHYFPDNDRNLTEGELYGISFGYFVTDDVEIALSYGEYHDMYSSFKNNKVDDDKDIKGSLSSLDAIYHFGEPGPGLRPYVSGGFSHQSASNVDAGGRNNSTYAQVGAGAKYYIGEHFYTRAGIDVMYNFDEADNEFMAGVGIGLNFGGTKAAPVVAAAAPVVAEPVAETQAVRVELDVKFDFDNSAVNESSYGDIENLANFMNQYPQTTTTVEGHTDSVGTDAYNQQLSEDRANAVREVLVDQYGVSTDRVDSVGYGESNPIADNSTAEGRAVNRRVEASVEAQAPVDANSTSESSDDSGSAVPVSDNSTSATDSAQ
ncbi:UNVERIFIED_CONTAM: hypothetical protein GTU68_002577 [Idotea baltica]|nr:hypothetical protein [Idotea baltica]